MSADLFLAPSPDPDVDDALRSGPDLTMVMRLAALLLAHAGRVSAAELRWYVTSLGVTGKMVRPPKTGHGSRGSKAGEVVGVAMRRLRAEGLVERDAEDWVATVSLAELAAWLADELEPGGTDAG